MRRRPWVSFGSERRDGNRFVYTFLVTDIIHGQFDHLFIKAVAYFGLPPCSTEKLIENRAVSSC